MEREVVIAEVRDTIINGWLYHDIRNMIVFEPKDNLSDGRLGCPLAFAILSGMGFLGYLFGDAKRNDSTKHIRFYVETFLDGYIVEESARNELGIMLGTDYRNMINYHFIPKFSFGVGKNLDDPRLDSGGLNMAVLGVIFLDSLNLVRASLDDPASQESIADRYLRLQQSNLSVTSYKTNFAALRFQGLIDDFKSRNKRLFCSRISPNGLTTTVSGTTTSSSSRIDIE